MVVKEGRGGRRRGEMGGRGERKSQKPPPTFEGISRSCGAPFHITRHALSRELFLRSF
jgi:hypothetical protein